jgi:hypothetical protein
MRLSWATRSLLKATQSYATPKLERQPYQWKFGPQKLRDQLKSDYALQKTHEIEAAKRGLDECGCDLCREAMQRYTENMRSQTKANSKDRQERREAKRNGGETEEQRTKRRRKRWK